MPLYGCQDIFAAAAIFDAPERRLCFRRLFTLRHFFYFAALFTHAAMPEIDYAADDIFAYAI